MRQPGGPILMAIRWSPILVANDRSSKSRREMSAADRSAFARPLRALRTAARRQV